MSIFAPPGLPSSFWWGEKVGKMGMVTKKWEFHCCGLWMTFGPQSEYMSELQAEERNNRRSINNYHRLALEAGFRENTSRLRIIYTIPQGGKA